MRWTSALLLALPALIVAAPTQTTHNFFYKGHDLSSLKLLEDYGSVYKDTSKGNETRPADAILADGGMNSVRLRIWVNPVDGVYGLQYNLDFAKRLQQAGYKIYLDFHFADSWADPNKQPPPAAWPLDLPSLANTLREYVKDTLVSFHQSGISLDIVALGNEIRHGMLWPVGYVDATIEDQEARNKNFTTLATLYKSARLGVDQALALGVPAPQVMIHIDDGWDTQLQLNWFSSLVANGVPTSAWDVFGFSFYPFYGTNATLANLKTTLDTLARFYNKPMQVVETDYPAICNGEYNPIPESSEPEIPYDIQGQLTWTEDVLSVVRNAPNGLGRGVHYWEPTWLNNTSLGSDCNDAILFDPDYSQYPIMIGYSRASVNLFQN